MSSTESCTLETCSLDLAYIQYLPSNGGNTFLLALFLVILLVQMTFLLCYRTWAFSITMICGLILEALGYVGRIKLHYNPFGFTNFLLYLVCLTIGPAFFGAAIYLCLGRIIIIHEGEDVSRLKPRTYTIVFVTCDVISLILQAAGGAITSSAETSESRTEGVNIMIAGLAFQVAALCLFMAFGAEFAIKSTMGSKKSRGLEPLRSSNPELFLIRNTRKWKWFLICIPVATVTIFIRSFFRVFELNGGFHSSLANNEPALMVLDGAMEDGGTRLSRHKKCWSIDLPKEENAKAPNAENSQQKPAKGFSVLGRRSTNHYLTLPPPHQNEISEIHPTFM
ncbi:RTA1 domain-containing protein [Aspergillus affinis]|uniref:RTA1 domain-containing protein n=1 Tax=Aspergillus affinis TaxID=1070780 RepID=UPI0022FDF1D3|nr:RTA1 like protein [Aspergillus affinis]KAI9042377.1 RTA1 like protein [Aspergillus affinis]